MTGLGKFTAKAAGAAADAVGGIMGSGTYPETKYGLAAALFERIAQAEKSNQDQPHDRAYYLTLMRQCLEVTGESYKPD